MKKVLLLALVLTNFMFVKAQNYDTLYIVDHNGETINYCIDSNDGIVIYGRPECPQNEFWVNGEFIYEDLVVIINNGEPQNTTVSLTACASFYICNINYTTSTITNPFAEPYIWKRTGESTQLYAPGNVVWSTGETEHEITVTEPGIYSVTISDACGSQTFSVEVRDNTEITLATCDLETNHNMVTWPTTSAQAEYVGTVEIKRDGMVVGTVNYSEGQFIDNIGSDAASRTYTITAIGTDGNPCPIPSYPKETIHMSYTMGMNNTIEIGWNTPTGYDLLGYNVCEWHENDGSLSVIDYVGASVTSYTCSQSQFDQGYIVVQGVEASKDGETRLFSNRSMDLVGLGENEATMFKVYPNPAKDRFIVEGSGTMTVTNTLGQTVLIQEIDEKATVELPQGMYFVKLGGATRKVVVE